MHKKSWFARLWEKVRALFATVNSWLSNAFDHIVYSKRASMIVSFMLAVLVCISINYEDLDFTFFNQGSTTYNLTAVPVEVQADTENYEVTGLPTTVDMTVTGDAADVQVFRNSQSSAAVIANLRDFGEGDNVVTFTPANVNSALNVTITPATANVRLDKKITRTFQVTPELLLGTGQKDSDFQTPVLEQDTVTIKATRAQLDSIRTVKAWVDASGQNADFSSNASVIAYNGSGEKVNVSITPETIPCTVKAAESETAQQKEETTNG